MAILQQLIPNKRKGRRKKPSRNANWLPILLFVLLALFVLGVRLFA
jgi:hypothetical protein